MPERVVVSGVDGGLLDPRTGSWDGARPALAALARLRVPLVLCSSRPRAELTLLWRLWGLDAPIIFENGAALLVPGGQLAPDLPGTPCDDGLRMLTLGRGREALAEELETAGRAAGVTIRRASSRPHGTEPPGPAYEHTEPFLLERDGEVAALQEHVERRGLRIVRGPRYWHLCGGADKGLAVRTLLSFYEREGAPPKAIGLGAWPTDIAMLRAVHSAVLMPPLGGSIHPELAGAFPRAARAAREGPRGWSEAVIAALAVPGSSRAAGSLLRTA